MSTTDQKIDDLAQMVANGFQEARDEMHQLRDEMHQENVRLRGDIDIMLDRHVGTFRKDYDELAGRVKRPEELVLTK